jgi:hypothetical protein
VQWDDLTGIMVVETLEEARAYCQSRAAEQEPKAVRHLPEQGRSISQAAASPEGLGLC